MSSATAGIAAAAGALLAVVSSCGDRKTETPPAKAVVGAPPSVAALARRPGLWSQRVSAGGRVQSSTLCVDARVEAAAPWFAEQAGQGRCRFPPPTRAGDGSFRFESDCDLGGAGRTISEGVARGDFSTRYRIESRSRTTGAAAPQMNGERTATIEAVWTGPCPDGMRPGDLRLAEGSRLNLLDLAAESKR